MSVKHKKVEFQLRTVIFFWTSFLANSFIYSPRQVWSYLEPSGGVYISHDQCVSIMGVSQARRFIAYNKLLSTPFCQLLNVFNFKHFV